MAMYPTTKHIPDNTTVVLQLKLSMISEATGPKSNKNVVEKNGLKLLKLDRP